MIGGFKNTAEANKILKNSLLYKLLNKCKKVLWYIFWFSSGINILVLFLPIYTSQVLDRVLSSGSVSTLSMLSIITVLSFAFSALLDIARSLVMTKVSDWLDSILSPDLIERSIALTTVKADNSTGQVIRDFNNIKSFVTGNSLFSFFDAPWSLIYLAAIFMIHPTIGIIAVIGIILLLSMALWNDIATKELLREINSSSIGNIQEIELAARNAEVVEAMGMMPYILSKWSKVNGVTRNSQVKATSRSAIIMSITKAMRSTIQIAVIGVGGYLAISGLKSAGGIIAASILMGRTLAPFETSIAKWKLLSSARASYKRLQFLILNAPRRKEAMQLPDPVGHVRFEKVVFRPYNSSAITLKEISFVINPGTMVGVVGGNAAGKSTIAKLMVGALKPLSGVVRLDGADVYTWPREHFGRFVGYLPQDIELFNATIKANIARMNTEPDAEKVVMAAKIAGVHEIILSLPNGYDTFIGTGGVSLSGGQKQMIGLARAFYGDIKLLVLDEPNSNLDSLGDKALMGALKYASEKKITTFIISHRLELFTVVDQIMQVHGGIVTSLQPREKALTVRTVKREPAKQ